MSSPRYLIAITGGIGSGKSVVSKILMKLGYPVYDCDSRAKSIMDSSEAIKTALRDEISPDVITADNSIDRKRLSQIVFSDSTKLAKLNGIVHSAVRDDILSWISDKKISFVETAILYESGLDRMVNQVWQVVAPPELRIERVMKRNGMTEQQIRARIEAQDGYEPERLHGSIRQIVNDSVEPLIPQILRLTDSLIG